MCNIFLQPISEAGAKVELVCHLLLSTLRKNINLDKKIRCQPLTKILQWPPILLSIKWKFHTFIHMVLNDFFLSLSSFPHQLVLSSSLCCNLPELSDYPDTNVLPISGFFYLLNPYLGCPFPGSWNTASLSWLNSHCTTSENLPWWLNLYLFLFLYNLLLYYLCIW